MDKNISIDKVMNMTEPSTEFFVGLEDNIYGIRFKGFKLRDVQTGEVFHSFKAEDIYELDYFADHELSYVFPNQILRAKNLGSNLTLVVGDNLVKDLTLIERHYIDDQLQANYKFDFPVFMPNSENNVEFMYPVPPLSKASEEKLATGEDVFAKSDTFIFVEGKLVIHRRASYVYSSTV
jgi:hypothetical protein